MATLTTVASGTSAVPGVSSHSGRVGLVIENSDANRLYVLLSSAGTVSSSVYSFSLAQNENALIPNYTGACSLIWAADGSGNAQITEYE